MKKFLKDFVKDEAGQDIVEYSLLLVLIGAAALFVLSIMGQSISQIFSKINTKLTSANEAVSKKLRAFFFVALYPLQLLPISPAPLAP